jgi:peptidoglycan/LPS O-acetylase OafA/YrhL
MIYRKEIDGLRALAVLPVILFHAGFAPFRGGFVGVDIFFVISGYLITTIIVGEIERGSFSLIKFYERRARRILPALFFMMLCTLPFAWYWMLPNQLAQFSETLIAVPLFYSNILFYLTSGYFETASELKPLLHTWSLAVEEQFYVLFPLFLLFSWRLGKKQIVLLLLLLALTSMLAAQWGSLTHPSFTFFLLPTRGFELLIGSLISLSINPQKIKESISQSLCQFLSISGLLLIVYAIVSFNDKTPYPSLYTLAPTLGASLILVFSSSQDVVGKLLGGKIFVGIGLISYSTYLWHQPLLAFARLKGFSELTSTNLLIILGSTVLLGYLSWRFVERPFRDAKIISLKKFTILSLVLAIMFVGMGFYGYKNEGLLSRFPIEAQLYVQYNDFKNWYVPVRKDQCHLQDINSIKHADICYENKRPLIALWGDSHASALYPGLKKLQEQYNFGVSQLTAAGCPPLSDIDKQSRLNCDLINTQNLQDLSKANPDILILHSAWQYGNNESIKNKLNDLLDRINISLPNTKIIIFGPVARWAVSPQHSSFLFWLTNKNVPVPNRLSGTVLTEMEVLLGQLSISRNVKYISLSKIMCNEDGCISRLGNNINDFMQIDSSHLSKAGSEFIMDIIKSEIVDDVHEREK